MLAKQFRLSASTKFKAPNIAYNQFFLVKLQKNNLENSRFGFVISKKVDKRAVVRNLLKRKFRSIIEKNWKNLSGWDVLFVFKKDALSVEKDKMEEEVNKVFLKL